MQAGLLIKRNFPIRGKEKADFEEPLDEFPKQKKERYLGEYIQKMQSLGVIEKVELPPKIERKLEWKKLLLFSLILSPIIISSFFLILSYLAVNFALPELKGIQMLFTLGSFDFIALGAGLIGLITAITVVYIIPKEIFVKETAIESK